MGELCEPRQSKKTSTKAGNGKGVEGGGSRRAAGKAFGTAQGEIAGERGWAVVGGRMIRDANG
jgi:hypothetical protein